jgi:hypothetical protein
MNDFKRRPAAAYRSYLSREILNPDENSWLALWQPKNTVAETGSESVNIH